MIVDRDYSLHEVRDMIKNFLYYINKVSEGRVRFILPSLVLCLLLVGCGKEIMYMDEKVDNSESAVSVEKLSSEDIDEEDSICVYVCGAVENEGVYEFDEGARIVDAVGAAGGFGAEACTTAVNLSEKLSDEQRIYVPTNDEVALLVEGENADKRININTASKERLMELKGIGETRAETIIRFREEHGDFKTIEEIMNVSGIGPSSFEKIKESIRVD